VAAPEEPEERKSKFAPQQQQALEEEAAGAAPTYGGVCVDAHHNASAVPTYGGVRVDDDLGTTTAVLVATHKTEVRERAEAVVQAAKARRRRRPPPLPRSGPLLPRRVNNERLTTQQKRLLCERKDLFRQQVQNT